MGKARILIIGFGTLLCSGSIASAVPILQLYLEGGEYDSTTETWVIHHHPDQIRLWVLGQTPVSDVKLAVAYEAGSAVDLSFLGSTTDGFGGFDDPSVAAMPVPLQTVTDGRVPKLGDGSDLPGHGIYGQGTEWQEFLLGDFSHEDSPIADFIDSVPAPGNRRGQINVYEVSFSGCSWVHFDVYDHVGASNHAKYVFAPFSHDGDITSPEPQAGVLFLLAGGLPMLLSRRRR